jgi:hypothetical protein
MSIILQIHSVVVVRVGLNKMVLSKCTFGMSRQNTDTQVQLVVADSWTSTKLHSICLPLCWVIDINQLNLSR